MVQARTVNDYFVTAFLMPKYVQEQLAGVTKYEAFLPKAKAMPNEFQVDLFLKSLLE